MQNVSDQFEASINGPYIAKITLDNTDVIQGDSVMEIHFFGNANGDNKKIAIGNAVAASVEIELDLSKVTVPVIDRKMQIHLGLKLADTEEWIPMGGYTATNAVSDDGTLTITGLDPIAKEFEVAYTPIDGYDFTASNGVSSKAFLVALCARRGVPADVSNLNDIPLKLSPDGYTERQILGMIAGLYGGFASIGRDGILRIQWYSNVEKSVDSDSYYEDGMEKADYDFQVMWLKCYNESMEETLCEGTPDRSQGIYFECIWMSQDILASIWEKLQHFSYRPVTRLSFLGDPRLDPGDIITLTDTTGACFAVPIMSIDHEFDGGLITSVTAPGESNTDSYSGPVTRELKRTTAQILKKQNEIELSIKNIDGNKVVSLINLAEDNIKIKASKIKFEGLVTANEHFKILEDGSIRATNAEFAGKITTDDITATGGTIGGCSIVDGVLKIKNVNIAEKLTASQIDATNLKVSAANITGTITAGKIVVSNSSGNTLLSAGDNKVRIGGWNVDENSLYCGSSFSSATCFLCTGSNASMSIGGSDSISGWVFKAGSNFGVTGSGALYANDVHLTGVINATYGKIGGWIIKDDKLYGEYGSLTVAISPVGVSGYYTKADGTKMPVTTTWDAILTAAERWNE